MIRLRLALPDGDVHRTFRTNPIVIGRSTKSDWSLPDAKGLSRFHCRLTLREGRCSVEDLGSRNGTLHNGKPVITSDLLEGDRLTLGALNFVIEAVRDQEPTEELVHPCLNCGHIFTAGTELCPRCGTSTRRTHRSRSIGEWTFPDHRLLKKLGAGGMGIVFEAKDLKSDRSVALKVLRPYLARNLAYLSRFIEEIRLLTSVRHPGIVEIYGRGKEGDLHYLTMELVSGKSAREVLRMLGPLPWRETARIGWEAAKALHAAHHQASVVHGDVKPGNMLLDERGHVKICDFGLAAVDLKKTPSRRRDREEHRRGTAAYAAPERFSEEGKPGVASDIYSLGVSLFQLATGFLPFQGSTVAALREAHLLEPVPPLRRRKLEVNPALEILIHRMMAKAPEDRGKGWTSVIDDLALLL